MPPNGQYFGKVFGLSATVSPRVGAGVGEVLNMSALIVVMILTPMLMTQVEMQGEGCDQVIVTMEVLSQAGTPSSFPHSAPPQRT